MANLQIKALPEDLHAELRRRARVEGVTVRAYVQRLIEADQALPVKTEWLARVRGRRQVELDVPVADLVRSDRADRTPARPRRGK